MYAVLYTHLVRDENEMEDYDQSKTKIYYCKKFKLACEYIKRRVDRLWNSYKKKENRGEIYIDDFTLSGDGSYGYIETSSTKCEYPYTIDEFRIIRMQEILDLPNGPSLRMG